VLIVDDNDLSTQDTGQRLMTVGYEVVDVVKTADAAVASATQHRPDFIIISVQLAGPRDGIEAAREIFSKLRIRCLFATAHVDAATRTRADAAKPLGWLRKPYSAENFLLVLAQATALLMGDRNV
jgi:two-component system, response regulator PdtaR